MTKSPLSVPKTNKLRKRTKKKKKGFSNYLQQKIIQIVKNNLSLNGIDGMSFNIVKDEWNISRDLSVNYIAKFTKD